jgi:hypothetical protein
VYNLVQSILNNSPVPHRGNLAPLMAFTGRPTDTPLISLVSPITVAPHTLSEIRIQQLIQVQDLCDYVASLHKQASTAAEKRRSAARARSATSHASIAPNFGSGDFVLVARREQRMDEKLSLRWRVPKRIVGTLSDHVYEVQDLENNAVAPVHSTGIRFYQD